jgi:predicted SprT family Zn-dependent metalloprotease
VLKKNATQRHGATKWQRGISRAQLGLEFVEVIELHPELLSGDWNAYAAFVLHHEFIHALGFLNHDSEFRHLEYSWPGVEAGVIGPDFTEFLRRRSAKWLWKCLSCSKSFPRKKPSKGKYRCRKCSTILTDVQT